MVSGRREPGGDAAVDAVKPAGGEATFVRADVAVEDEVKNLVAKIVGADGRLGTADEIAGAVLFLVSEGVSFITGDSLKVDGGFVAQ